MSRVHFVGIGGSGMSALAQFHAMGGGQASGSDRFLAGETRVKLEALGIELFAQDGSGTAGAGRLVVSTAIEEDNADLLRARALGLKITHRADELAAHVKALRTVAVAGTSGKSTVAAMIFEIMEAAGHRPSVITGGNLISLRRRGFLGNAFRGKSDLLVAEADESDGTLPKYEPWMGVLLNMGKDHMELEKIRDLFLLFRSKSKKFLLNADAGNLAALREGSATFGFQDGDVLGEKLELDPEGSRFTVRGARFSLPIPGRHNAENALAATAACLEAGVELGASAEALARYQGVSRRFERVGTARGVEVIDDYAHNPDKVRAALRAAHLRSRRVLAVFQPHGFGPTRFLKNDFIDAFSAALEPEDILWMPDIYYAGGTAVKNISSKDIADPIVARGRQARHVPDREAIIPELVRASKSGDVILIMGARDLSLGAFAARVLAALG